MKSFLSNLFVFFGLIAIFAFPLDYGISYLLRHSNGFYGEIEVWKDIYDKNANCDIAVYGSSRAWVQYNSQQLAQAFDKEVYNFGIDGHIFRLQNFRHSEFFKNNKKPKYIIQSVDNAFLKKPGGLYNLEQFLPFMLFNSNIKNGTEEYEGFSNLDFYLPLYRYFGRREAVGLAMLELLPNQKKKTRIKGYQGQDKEWNSDFDKAKTRDNAIVFEVDESSLQLYKDFLTEMNKKDIQVIMVYPPEFIEGQKFIANRTEIIQLFTDLSTDFDVPFIDFSDDELCLDKKNFYNASHLNKKGSEIFTEKLIQKLKPFIDFDTIN